MHRILLFGLALLPLGPGVALALHAFGCEGSAPVLDGGFCSQGLFTAWARLTLLAWALLGGGIGAVQLLRRARRAPPPGTGPRLWALCALLCEGLLLAAAGLWLSGDPRWALAVPAVLAAGWLVLANPLDCTPGAGRRGAV